jgi:hypothetical protein
MVSQVRKLVGGLVAIHFDQANEEAFVVVRLLHVKTTHIHLHTQVMRQTKHTDTA